MSSMKIKVILGHDIRLWRYSVSECTLSSLKEFVSSPSSFGLSRFWLQWEDDEGDRITLQEEQDFNGALTCAQEEDRKSLKIYVLRGSNRSAHGNPTNESNAAFVNSAWVVGECRGTEFSPTATQEKCDEWASQGTVYLGTGTQGLGVVIACK